MKRKNGKYTYTLLLMLAVLAAGVSCVNDNSLEECPPEPGPGPGPGTTVTPVTLFVDFAEKLYTRASPSDEVQAMYVFVFDHDGYYITTLYDPEPDINGDYSMEVPLEPGDYEFIGWTNLDSSYILSHADLYPGETTVEELFIELDIIEGDTIDVLPEHLHYGMTRVPRLAEDTGWEYMMEMDRYTYTINIITEGLPNDGYPYRYTIADRNGRLSFYSEDMSERTIYYVNDCAKDATGQLSSSLRVLRLMEDHLDSRVYIENTETGSYLFEDNLIERLLSLRELGQVVDFSTKFEYTIKLVFHNYTLLSISIDGWIVYQNDYEI